MPPPSLKLLGTIIIRYQLGVVLLLITVAKGIDLRTFKLATTWPSKCSVAILIDLLAPSCCAVVGGVWWWAECGGGWSAVVGGGRCMVLVVAVERWCYEAQALFFFGSGTVSY